MVAYLDNNNNNKINGVRNRLALNKLALLEHISVIPNEINIAKDARLFCLRFSFLRGIMSFLKYKYTEYFKLQSGHVEISTYIALLEYDLASEKM